MGVRERFGALSSKKVLFWLIWDTALIFQIRPWSLWNGILEKMEYFINLSCYTAYKFESNLVYLIMNVAVNWKYMPPVSPKNCKRTRQ